VIKTSVPVDIIALVLSRPWSAIKKSLYIVNIIKTLTWTTLANKDTKRWGKHYYKAMVKIGERYIVSRSRLAQAIARGYCAIEARARNIFVPMGILY